MVRSPFLKNSSLLLIAAIMFECLILLLLLSQGNEDFSAFVSTPDTNTYTNVAMHLAQNGELIASPRTLGYPMFLYIGYLLGGTKHATRVIIVLQLILNIALTIGFWKLVNNILPKSDKALKLGFTIFFFWTGIGMALMVTTDFLAAFLFFIFLYGFLFWRNRYGFLAAAAALALATLVRPAFTFIPLLLIPAAWMVGKFSCRVPLHLLAGFMVLSLVATGASVSYQRACYGYNGPSSVTSYNIMTTLYHGLGEEEVSKVQFYEQFKRKVSLLSQKPNSELSKTEEEAIAWKIFFSELRASPFEFSSYFLKTFIKYIFAPVESILSRALVINGHRQFYFSYLRPLFTLFCLPAWILSLIPPINAHRKMRWYYILIMTMLLYVVGISLIAPRQGERIRYPVLAFLLPIALWNANVILLRIRSRLGR